MSTGDKLVLGFYNKTPGTSGMEWYPQGTGALWTQLAWVKNKKKFLLSYGLFVNSSGDELS